MKDYKKGIRYNNTTKGRNLIIGPIGSVERNRVNKLAGLEIVSGDEKHSKVLMKYKGEIITELYSNGHNGIDYFEGMRVDANGHATVFIENDEKPGREVVISTKSNYRKAVYSSLIELSFEGMDDIDIQKS